MNRHTASEGLLTLWFLCASSLMATGDPLYEYGGKGRLSQGSCGHHRVRSQREILFRVPQAVTLEVDDVPAMEERDTRTCDVRGPQQAVYLRVDLRGRESTAVWPGKRWLLRYGC